MMRRLARSMPAFVAGLLAGLVVSGWAESPCGVAEKKVAPPPVYLKGVCPGGHLVWNGVDTLTCTVP